MFQNLKYTFKHTAIYSLGNLSTKIIGLILLPLYTEYLSPTEYGTFAILEATSQIMVGILALNLPMAMLRWCAGEKKVEKQKSIIFTTIVALSGFIILQLALLLPNTTYFSQLLFDTSQYKNYFFYLFLSVAFGIYNGIPLNLIRINEKPVFYIFANILKFVIILLLNIYLIVYKGEGLIGIIKSQLIGEIVLFTVTLRLVFKNILVRFDLHVFKGMLKFGTPLIFSTISVFTLSFADRYIIQYFLNTASVGIYSIGYKFASVMNILLIQSFQLGFVPIAYKKVGAPDEKRFFSKTLTYFSFLLILIALILSLFSKELIQIIVQDPGYTTAYTVVPILTYMFVFKGIQYAFSLSFHYAKTTAYIAIINIVAAVLNIIFNFIFIPLTGFMGAAISMLLSTTIMMLLSYYYGMKVYPISYEIKKLIMSIAVFTFFLILTFVLVNEINLLIRLIVKILMIAAFPLLLYYLGYYEKIEIKRIKEIWIIWRNPKRWKRNFKNIKS